ncbi:outer membrane beta-barrel protein [Stenotrophobium rhamnosiphilum]|uniref:Porin n=1 Tax=Stenotrophobium rhamnosiphilum TaxID=2029166 RepID=A0A2T5MFX7_9GAMM|nr:outer membrane beta-barrel protein [Stenotrophobium rhamnosiphilum]PTU31470.1 hypothetical protein CJD38_09040 [Stenotrophobium rhamnosiphilum]
MRKNIIVAAASLAFLPVVSFAAAPTLTEVLDASGVSLTGHASGSWAYNHVTANGGGGSLTTNQFTFDQAQLTISKLPAEGFGASVDIYAGQDVAGGTYNYVDPFAPIASVPQNILPTGFYNKYSVLGGAGGSEVVLHQAFVQYASGGLTVIGGKFATLAGYEVAADGSNNNATRSILFSQQAFTLTGVRVGYKVSDMATLYVGLSNSVTAPIVPLLGLPAPLPNTYDFDPQKTVEVGVALAPIKGLAINVTDYRGTEVSAANGPGTAKNNLLDAVVSYSIGDLSFAYNGDYNTSKTAGSNAKFLGHALYANYQITSKVRAGVRGELTNAWDSVVGGPKVKRNEVTLTGDYAAAKNFNLISDVRYASVQNDGALFIGPDAHQTSFVLKAVYKF